MYVSYVNLVDDTVKRHYEQEIFWHFKCQCKVCQDETLDKRKHSLKCNNCKNIRPINLESWKIYKYDSQAKSKYGLCNCVIPDDDQATEQDLRMYKYIWNKVTKIEPAEKVFPLVRKNLYV